ncbi:MAG: sulfatase-like hydrolase/transferase [Opitutaceae bacterium]
MTDSSDSRPDILLIMPDQMRGDCLSLEDHPVLMTPNIDAIGRQGTHFTRAYTSCPSCIPARRALLTGLHPARNGLVGYKDGCPLRHPTFTERLLEHGYRTTLVGRHMHQHPYDEPYGFEDRVFASGYIEDDDYSRDLEAAFPGQGGFRGHGLSNNGWTARPWQFPDPWHPTNWVVNRAREKIREAPADRPHCITASFFAPHPPLLPPAFYFDRYRRSALPDRAIGSWVSKAPDDPAHASVDSNRVDLQGEALRSAQAGYFGLINHLDDQVHSLVFEFRKHCAKRGRPWVIVFTSDHGEMLGDHHLFRKCEPYEGSARIPFLIQGSPELGLACGHHHQGPVCLEDIGPTLLDLAGAPQASDLDGQSLLPILRGGTVSVRAHLHIEHCRCYDADQAFHCLTDGRWKYIWRPETGTEQLFDLQNDPRELSDLAKETTHSKETDLWRNRLIARLTGRPEGFSDGGRLTPGRTYVDEMGAMV